MEEGFCGLRFRGRNWKVAPNVVPNIFESDNIHEGIESITFDKLDVLTSQSS